MNKFLLKAEEMLGENTDLIDVRAYYDSTLTLNENLNALEKIAKNLGFIEDKNTIKTMEDKNKFYDSEMKAKQFEVTKKTEFGNSDLIKKMLKQPCVILLCGARGTGKTASAFRIAEVIRKHKKCDINLLNFPRDVLDMKSISHPDEASNESIIIADELGITNNARRSMGNLDLMEMMVLARQNGQTLIATVQNSALSDLNILRSLDILLLKEPSLMQIEFERPALKKIFVDVKKSYEMIKDDKRGYVYVYDENFRGLVNVKLPTFWSDDISKAWSKKKVDKGCIHEWCVMSTNHLQCYLCKVSRITIK